MAMPSSHAALSTYPTSHSTLHSATSSRPTRHQQGSPPPHAVAGRRGRAHHGRVDCTAAVCGATINMVMDSSPRHSSSLPPPVPLVLHPLPMSSSPSPRLSPGAQSLRLPEYEQGAAGRRLGNKAPRRRKMDNQAV